MRSVGIILLAAGGSTRMGRPKQLLPWRGSTLLHQATCLALTTELAPIVVVLGAEAAACAREIEDLPAILCLNPDWQQGMGTSVRAGLRTLLEKAPDVAAVLIMLHDQPLVTTSDLKKLAEMWQPPERLIACAFYGGAPGVPAVFDRSLFAELSELPPQQGAKKVLLRHAAAAAHLELPNAACDIDLPEDHARLSRPDNAP